VVVVVVAGFAVVFSSPSSGPPARRPASITKAKNGAATQDFFGGVWPIIFHRLQRDSIGPGDGLIQIEDE
jgi:hypothetical protein